MDVRTVHARSQIHSSFVHLPPDTSGRYKTIINAAKNIKKNNNILLKAINLLICKVNVRLLFLFMHISDIIIKAHTFNILRKDYTACSEHTRTVRTDTQYDYFIDFNYCKLSIESEFYKVISLCIEC